MKSDSRNLYAVMLLYYGIFAAAEVVSVWLEPVVEISRIVLKPLIVFPLIGFWAWGDSRKQRWANHNSRVTWIAATGVIQSALWGYYFATGEWRQLSYMGNPELWPLQIKVFLALFWAAFVWLVVSYKRRPM